jgi:hypothetical protein
MKRAEGHIFCLGLYEILTQPSNILAKPCRFKMLQRTNRTKKLKLSLFGCIVPQSPH